MNIQSMSVSMEKYVMPLANKLGNEIHLRAIRDVLYVPSAHHLYRRYCSCTELCSFRGRGRNRNSPWPGPGSWKATA